MDEDSAEGGGGRPPGGLGVGHGAAEVRLGQLGVDGDRGGAVAHHRLVAVDLRVARRPTMTAGWGASPGIHREGGAGKIC